MTRTFLAADVDDALRSGAASIAEALRRQDLRGRWVDPSIMHATVRFLGDVDDARVAHSSVVVPALAAGEAPIRVDVVRLGAFPDARRARVLFLPLEDDGALARCHDESEGERRSARLRARCWGRRPEVHATREAL